MKPLRNKQTKQWEKAAENKPGNEARRLNCESWKKKLSSVFPDELALEQGACNKCKR